MAVEFKYKVFNFFFLAKERFFKLTNKPGLYMESGSSLVLLKTLKSRSYSIGRAADSLRDIQLNSSLLSKHHATIKRKGLDYYLIDEISTNGTVLNGERVIPGKEYILVDESTIEMGGITLKYFREIS